MLITIGITSSSLLSLHLFFSLIFSIPISNNNYNNQSSSLIKSNQINQIHNNNNNNNLSQQARDLDKKVRVCWEPAKRFVVVDNSTSFNKKVEKTIAAVEQHLNEYRNNNSNSNNNSPRSSNTSPQ